MERPQPLNFNDDPSGITPPNTEPPHLWDKDIDAPVPNFALDTWAPFLENVFGGPSFLEATDSTLYESWAEFLEESSHWKDAFHGSLLHFHWHDSEDPGDAYYREPQRASLGHASPDHASPGHASPVEPDATFDYLYLTFSKQPGYCAVTHTHIVRVRRSQEPGIKRWLRQHFSLQLHMRLLGIAFID